MPAAAWSPLCWGLALAVGVAVHRARTPHGTLRFALGAWLGAGAAHAGWLLLHAPQSAGHPEWWWRAEGASLLFLPLGVLLAAPWREALAALPLALAVARLGCLPFACCYPAAWAALPELAGYAAMHRAARRWPDATAPIVLSGFGAIRLLSLPLRVAPPLVPLLDPAWLAAAWLLAGFALRRRIGSAERARPWPTARAQPLLDALALMLGVWLLYPLAGVLWDDAGVGLLAASLAALALLWAARRCCPLRVATGSPVALGVALLSGWAVAALLAPAAESRCEPLARLAVVALTPVVEELLYRERLLGALRQRYGGPAALLASSALFALGHADARGVPMAFAGGLACGALVLRGGSLAVVVGLHAGWNLRVA